MGCDIHLHTEVKIGGEWHHYSSPNVDVKYQELLFAKMAGVLGTHGETLAIPISNAKGFPDDLSLITRMSVAWWGPERVRHPSWLARDEIALLFWWIEEKDEDFNRGSEVFGDCLGFSWRKHDLSEDCETYVGDEIPEVEDVRFVFWFDN